MEMRNVIVIETVKDPQTLKLVGYILIAAGGGYAGNEVITTLMQ